MKKIVLMIGLTLFLISNDSEYYTSGNELVPIDSTNIRLDKEVLSIKRVPKAISEFSVNVDYILINEGKKIDTIIGFEAPGQVGDSESDGFFFNTFNNKKLLNAEKRAIKDKKVSKNNEYISNFKVKVNGKNTAYKIVDVGHIKKDKNSSPYIGQLYYFNTHLHKGVNTLHHHYIFQGEESVVRNYALTYILETAKRWKGGKIRDFTFKVDMGKNAKFYIGANDTLQNAKNWTTKDGKIKLVTFKDDSKNEGMIPVGTFLYFSLKTGKATFHKHNFIPDNAIWLFSIGGVLSIIPPSLN